MNRANHSDAAKTVLSPRELAAAIGVSESSVKRWVDDRKIRSFRTAGGHRRIRIAEAIRFIRETGSAVVDGSMLGLPVDAVDRRTGRSAPDHALYDLLERGADREAARLIVGLYLGGTSIAEIVDGPIKHSLEGLGAYYLENDAGILIEHRATVILASVLHQLQTLLPSVESPAAIGGAPAGDPYIIPSLAAATVLLAEGYRAVNLGPETPISTIDAGARDSSARVVWVSLTARPQATVTAELQQLARDLRDQGSVVVVGGRTGAGLALNPAPNLVVGGSMSELAAVAKGALASPD